MKISGLETIDEFNDYLNKCGHYGINVLKYDKCYVSNVNIPIKKIKLKIILILIIVILKNIRRKEIRQEDKEEVELFETLG